jgi:hypothetical protein
MNIHVRQLEQVIGDAKDRGNLNSLLKILAIIIIKVHGGKVQTLQNSIGKQNYPAAVSFLKKFDANSKLFINMYNGMLKTPAQVAALSLLFVTDFRKSTFNTNKSNIEVIPVSYREILVPMLTLLSDPQNSNALTQLNKKISIIKEPTISSKFGEIFTNLVKDAISENVTIKKDEHHLDTMYNRIHEIIFKLTKSRTANSFSTEQRQEFRKDSTKAQLLKEFDTLKKQLTEVKANEIGAIVKASGKSVLSIKDVIKELKNRNVKYIDIHPDLRSATQIYYDQDGDMTDSKGKEIQRSSAPHDVRITINPKYNGSNYIFQVENKAGPTKVYTKDKVKGAKAANFAKVDKLLTGQIEKIKSKWRSHMTGSPESEQTVFANLTEYTYQTASRIGSKEGETAGERTYGGMNFLVKHITSKSPSRLVITYPVKSGAIDTFVITTAEDSHIGGISDSKSSKTLINFILQKCKGKGKDGIVFTVSGNPINYNRFGAYLKGIGFGTAKTFRTLRGTQLADTILKEAKEKYVDTGEIKTQKDANDLFDAAMEEVGNLLGHVRFNKTTGKNEQTGATAVGNYINPSLMIDWFKAIGFTPNAKVINAAKNSGIEEGIIR